MTVVDEYLSSVNKTQRAGLEQIRGIIKKIAPDSEEAISYGIPVFHYKNKYLIGFAAFREHLSLFPESGPIEAFKYDLRNYKLSKGTIRFTADNPLPEALIQKIVKYNIAKIDKPS
jgi:uncharacterized protein YdhG (YjbR/CyaY superfamily)